MSKTILSVDLGTSETKFVVVRDEAVLSTALYPTPDHLVVESGISSADALADFLHECVVRSGIKCKTCAAVLSSNQAFTRSTTLPVMSADQLELNLPYEFKDYISQGKEKYTFDYAMLEFPQDPTAEGAEMSLMACAAPKVVIDSYVEGFRRAGLKLKTLIPEEFAYRNLIHHSRTEDQTICLIDLGHTTTRLHIYQGQRYDISRVIDSGGLAMDQALSDGLGVDIHIARAKKTTNQDGAQESELCQDLYRGISMDIMRAINFYSYESQGSLDQVYVFGGGSLNRFLMQELRDTLDVELLPISDLVGTVSGGEQALTLTPRAIGAAWQ